MTRQARVYGLDEILAALYAEGRKVNEETAEEIINRLEAKKNYIPSSDRVRKEYAYVLLKEYRRICQGSSRQRSEISGMIRIRGMASHDPVYASDRGRSSPGREVQYVKMEDLV